jgi:hypothetical protein
VRIYNHVRLVRGTSTAAVDDGAALPAIDPGIRLFPNPGRAEAAIEFGLQGSGVVGLWIYDAGGRLVRAIDGGLRAPGRQRIEWDRRDSSGARVPAGTYFLRLETPEGVRGGKYTIAP